MGGATNLKISLIIAVLVVAVVGSNTAAKTIYVDADANGLNDGSSWINAYKYLQDALADANSSIKPVEIRVTEDVYSPDQDSGGDTVTNLPRSS